MEAINLKDVDTTKSIIIDGHLLKTYRACQRKYFYFDIEHVVSLEAKAAPAFGIVMHEALAEFRISKRAGNNYTESLKRAQIKLVQMYKKIMPAEYHTDTCPDMRRSASNALRILQGLCEYHEPQGFEYLYIEQPFAIYLGKVLGKDLIYVGIVDAVLKDLQRIYVNDLKTTTWSIGQNWLAVFKMDQSLLGYLVATKTLLGVDTNYVLVSGAYVQSPPKTTRGKPLSECFILHPVYWTDQQIEEWHENTLNTVEDIELKKRHYGNDKSKWIMDFGQSCGAYGKCEYLGICSSPDGTREQIIKSQYMRALWCPLEEERLQAIETEQPGKEEPSDDIDLSQGSQA